MAVAIVPIWLSSITCAVFLLLCLVVLYILLKEQIEDWLQDREERKLLKAEQEEYEAFVDKIQEYSEADIELVKKLFPEGSQKLHYVKEPKEARPINEALRHVRRTPGGIV